MEGCVLVDEPAAAARVHAEGGSQENLRCSAREIALPIVVVTRSDRLSQRGVVDKEILPRLCCFYEGSLLEHSGEVGRRQRLQDVDGCRQ